MRYEVYRATCPLGRHYVGCTSIGMANRWLAHYGKPPREWSDAEADISDAIKRFGRDSFTLCLLAVAFDEADAAAIETAMIEAHKAYAPHGYNRKKVGGYTRAGGFKHHVTAAVAAGFIGRRKLAVRQPAPLEPLPVKPSCSRSVG